MRGVAVSLKYHKFNSHVTLEGKEESARHGQPIRVIQKFVADD